MLYKHLLMYLMEEGVSSQYIFGPDLAWDVN